MSISLDALLREELLRHGPHIQARNSDIDPFLNPATYVGWLPVVRWLLALRYVRWRQALLRERMLADPEPNDTGVAEAVLRHVQAAEQTPISRLLRWSLRSWLPGVGLLLLLVATSFGLGVRYFKKTQQTQLRAGLIAHGEILLLRQTDPRNPKLLHRTLALRRQILDNVPKDRAIQESLLTALDAAERGARTVDLAVAFASVNQAVAAQRSPLYFAPFVVSAPCGGPHACRSALILPYDVEARRFFRYGNRDYSVVRLRRSGRSGFHEHALSLTVPLTGISHIYNDRVHQYLIENTLPALAGEGHSWLFPWLSSGTSSASDAALAISTDLRHLYGSQVQQLTRYVKRLLRLPGVDRQARMRRSLLDAGHRPYEEEWLPLGSAHVVEEEEQLLDAAPDLLAALEGHMQDALSYHEVQHQINDGLGGIPEGCDYPLWGKFVLPDEVPRLWSICDEVSASLVELHHGKGVRHILLTKLLTTALSTVGTSSSTRAASRIILLAIDDVAAGDAVSGRGANGPMRIQAAFAVISRMNDEQLASAASRAYADLFRMQLPQLAGL